MDGNAGKFVTGHVTLYTVEFFKYHQQKVEMFNANVFNTKVIHDEAKLEQTLFMAPKSRRGSHFIEALRKKLQSENVIG